METASNWKCPNVLLSCEKRSGNPIWYDKLHLQLYFDQTEFGSSFIIDCCYKTLVSEIFATDRNDAKCSELHAIPSSAIKSQTVAGFVWPGYNLQLSGINYISNKDSDPVVKRRATFRSGTSLALDLHWKFSCACKLKGFGFRVL